MPKQYIVLAKQETEVHFLAILPYVRKIYQSLIQPFHLNPIVRKHLHDVHKTLQFLRIVAFPGRSGSAKIGMTVCVETFIIQRLFQTHQFFDERNNRHQLGASLVQCEMFWMKKCAHRSSNLCKVRNKPSDGLLQIRYAAGFSFPLERATFRYASRTNSAAFAANDSGTIRCNCSNVIGFPPAEMLRFGLITIILAAPAHFNRMLAFTIGNVASMTG